MFPVSPSGILLIEILSESMLMASYESMTLLEKIANTVRFLSIDAVQKANSGHPGMPMGCADFAAVLWADFLKHDPANPSWPDRDRFVLSAGHASSLLYSMLHVAGYDLSLDDMKAFRQWGSRTPGHPERWCVPGVEATTGCLGQGFANGVGLALAEAHLAEFFNRKGANLVDHFTYGIVSDGDLMEGVASEAASLAGHMKLQKLIYFYDSNEITIEGSTALAWSEDVRKRFEAYGWHVLDADGHDHAALILALDEARACTTAPSLIIGRTHIAKGSPNKQDSEKSHGSPLGEEEVQLTRENLGWPDETFFVPAEVREFFTERAARMAETEGAWRKMFNEQMEKEPELARLWGLFHEGGLPEGLIDLLPDFRDQGSLATRAASGKVLQGAAGSTGNLIGGSADLAPSNKTFIEGAGTVEPGSFGGSNIHFGVREHGMASILNGVGIHGGLRPYCGTFLVFADYMRPAIRMAAMSEIPVIYVFTHDSIFVGEDGPTHQPIEHLAVLRAIPGLNVIRPADPTETSAAWAAALDRKDGPTALILTRQKVPVLDAAESRLPPVERGAYVVKREEGGECGLVIVATGSEVHAAMEAKDKLGEAGRGVRVVSMPSWELFDAQPVEYRDGVIPPQCTKRLAVEAGLPLGWSKYIGTDGVMLGIETYGASAPGSVLGVEYGMNGDAVAREARRLLGL